MARILDLTSEVSVYAARLLAECGHDVIRVECRKGDAVRRTPPFLRDEIDLEHGAFHRFFNTGKRSFTADVGHEAGRDLFFDLLATSDAVLAGSRCSIPVDNLVNANPKAVVAIVEGEAEGDVIGAAGSGLLALVGEPDGEPLVLGGHAMNCAVGLYAGLAVSAALQLRKISGTGQKVRISAEQALLAMCEQAAIACSTEGRIPGRRGFRGEITAASSAFAAADGYWMLSVTAAGKAWKDFVDWVQDPVLLADTSLEDEAQRRAKQHLIAERLDAWSLLHNKNELIAEAQRRRIPSSPVSTVLDVAGDEQLIARGFLAPEVDGEFGSAKVPQGALATASGRSLRPAPRLGQHNAEILAELGYTRNEHAALLAAGAL